MRHRFGSFALDVDQRRLFNGTTEVRLQPKGFDLLRLLVTTRPKALSKDEILAAVWPGVFISENSLATVVRDLRSALGDNAQEPAYIRTVYGYGYAFVAPATDVAAPDVTADGVPAEAAPASSWRLIHDHREIRLREGANVIGRSGHDVIILASPTVSRHHAVVHVAGSRATVEDLGSKNGTWVGPTPVIGPVALTSGVEVRLGSVVATAHYDAATPTTDTAILP